jgi:putative NIF3 family GTP cyclohydrolase 1 type 2
MTVHLRDVVAYLDTTLEIDRFRDYAPNGLQVEGAPEVDTVVTGVSANQALFDRAIELGADLIVVHHGLIWGGGLPTVTGPTARRLKRAPGQRRVAGGVPPAARQAPAARQQHRPGRRDRPGAGRAHRVRRRQGRGARAGRRLGHAAVARRGDRARHRRRGRRAAAPFVFPYGPPVVRKVGLCSGAAGDLLEAAVAAGCDLFVTGELAERAGELARELQITLVAAGHYATEVFGPSRVADELRRQFPALSVHFVPVATPL